MKKNLYRSGRIAEGKVANRLRGKGYFVRRSKGSRGPADLKAYRGNTLWKDKISIKGFSKKYNAKNGRL